jgi:phenylacetic acid degradation operon negative regulatory protein
VGRRRLPELGIQPLPARSLALSALLGTHPPQLPVRALVALGSLFGVAEGTMRTALSRMLDAGELTAADGVYRLGERMLERQVSQDAGRRPAPGRWDGWWWFAIVDADRRSVTERRAFRTRMRHLRMGELRPDVWLRPSNLPGPETGDDVLVVRGPINEREPSELVRRLWDLEQLRATARTLTAVTGDALAWIDADGVDALADTFLVSVAAVRFLLTEPLLPAELVGPDWPPDELRAAYDRLDAAHRAVMSSFLTAVSRPA